MSSSDDRLTPDELAERVRVGGSIGGKLSAASRRARRERYLAGTMSAAERAKYVKVLAKLRAAGTKGGQVIARRAARTRAERNVASDDNDGAL